MVINCLQALGKVVERPAVAFNTKMVHLDLSDTLPPFGLSSPAPAFEGPPGYEEYVCFMFHVSFINPVSLHLHPSVNVSCMLHSVS